MSFEKFDEWESRHGHGRHFGHNRWRSPEDERPFGGGPFGGGPFGKRWGGFGPRAEHLFARGELKYVILELLREQPRHGYDVIRALDERFRGLYTPSPGTIYPILQMLEDQGYIRGQEQDGKRIYSVTEEGRSFLSEQSGRVDDIHARADARWSFQTRAEVADLMEEASRLGRSLFHQIRRAMHHLDPSKLGRIKAVLARARDEIDAILAEDPSTPPVV